MTNDECKMKNAVLPEQASRLRYARIAAILAAPQPAGCGRYGHCVAGDCERNEQSSPALLQGEATHGL
ncbi:MAG: hypothetical protein DRP64_18780 [Verrucomicrobia bacterium]|nr:MAG: hypothetical protein DRP64_18780 [Verrucomicrobiota bacterium]